MASIAADPEPAGITAGSWRLILVPVFLVVVLAVLRLVVGGWDSLSADHARYVYSGMSVLDGRGFVNEAGDPYLLRSPAYPLLVGGAFSLAGDTGAHLVAWLLGLLGVLLSIAYASRLGGAIAALATAVALASVPILWEQLVSMGIDLPQAGVYLLAVMSMWRPAVVPWLAAGATLGIATLVKETVAPAVVLLPLAWLPMWSGLSGRRWLQLALVFGASFALVAGWWWLYVWRETGMFFPLNALQAIVADENAGATLIAPAALPALLIAGLAWLQVISTRRSDQRVRLLAFAALALLPAAAATFAFTQAPRNLTSLVMLSCIAVGLAVADLVRWGIRRFPGRGRTVAAGFGFVLVVSAIAGQLAVRAATSDPLATEAAGLLRDKLAPGDQLLSSFRYRSALGLELFDRDVSVRLLPVRAVGRPVDPKRYLWLGERRGTLFGLARADWARVAGAPSVTYLAVATPHPLSPSELIPALRSDAGPAVGLTWVTRLEGPTGRVDIFEVDPALVDDAGTVGLHARPAALVHWLDLAQAAGDADAVNRLLAARPVIPRRSAEMATLVQRLGREACFRTGREGDERVLTVEPRRGQDDCVQP